MTGRERMLKTLRFEEPDRPPHFEIMFELEREAFALAFPDRRLWGSCTPADKERMVEACMAIYARIVERYEWDALAVFWPWSDPDGVRAARRTFGDRILIGSIVGGTTWSIEGMTDWMQFAVDLAEHPERIRAEAEARTARALATFDRLADAGADFIHVVNDVAFNGGPFISPAQFHEFVTPHLARQVAHIRRRGVLPFVHTDGDILPVLDDYLSLGAACFQSVDPMAGMDIAEVKRRCHGRLALMGNVQCSLLQDGPRAAIRDSALYCLTHASPGGGYIFGTSNTIFPGMPLANYEYMLEVYREFCAGGAAACPPQSPGRRRKVRPNPESGGKAGSPRQFGGEGGRTQRANPRRRTKLRRTTMPLTAGLIGCGSIARFHADGLQKARVRVKWVCDISEEAGRRWAGPLGATWTPDYAAVIADPEVNLVDVTTISSIHKPVCCAAIRAGKAVICEKTLAENADDALEIVRLAEEKQTIFYTSYMKRFIPAVQKAKALMPELGRILSTHIRAYQCWGQLWEGNPANGFAHTPVGGRSEVVRRYGGGILVCGGSHILDLVGFFLGRPRRLFATMVQPADRDYDLQAAALLETGSGIVHYEALAHPLHRIGFLRDGWDERIEINGIHGRLEVYSAAWDQFEHKASMLVHYDNRTGNATEYRYAPESPFNRAVAFFCANIEQGRQGDQSRVTGYDVDELIEHVKRSAATGLALDVAWRV